MQELRFVAVSEDGSYAVLAVPGRSGRFILPIDERLRAVAQGPADEELGARHLLEATAGPPTAFRSSSSGPGTVPGKMYRPDSGRTFNCASGMFRFWERTLEGM